MNELQDTLEEIMEIFKCQDNMLDILEEQQHQLEQLKSVNLKQQELLEKLNAENRRLSAENWNLTIQNQKLVAQNKQLQELCKEKKRKRGRTMSGGHRLCADRNRIETVMNESENLWNVDSLLKLSEDLQVENEQYRLLLAQKENQIQTHLSDAQKLKSQIHSMQSTIAEQRHEIQKLNAHIAILAESDLVLVENEKLIDANRKLRAENEKAQNTFKEAMTKTEDAKKILAQAKTLNEAFDKRVREKVSRVKRTIEADMKGRLQTALQKQTVTLSIWTWAFCFICMIQTGYILFMNRDVAKTIPKWFIKRWENGYDIVKMITELYQWCYGYLTDYMHPYVVSGIMVLVSVGIIAVTFVPLRNVFDWFSDKWHDRWQYYEVYGEICLRKAVPVALCIVSVTFALIAGKYIPLDVNVVSWWIGFSFCLIFLYHGCYKMSQ